MSVGLLTSVALAAGAAQAAGGHAVAAKPFILTEHLPILIVVIPLLAAALTAMLRNGRVAWAISLADGVSGRIRLTVMTTSGMAASAMAQRSWNKLKAGFERCSRGIAFSLFVRLWGAFSTLT